ncbi:MAG TPA: S8 family serine peptidase [Candidatus Eisenbacteria bacterium]|jgi:subtilisin family serine protease
MTRAIRTIAGCLLVSLAWPQLSQAAGAKVGPALARLLATNPEQSVAAWVYFTDRAGSERDPLAYEAVRRALPARSLERRAMRGRLRDLTASDLPVHAPYVRALVQRGARLRGASRWLNAASVQMPAALAIEIERLPFVARIELVPRGWRITPIPEPETAPAAETGVRTESASGATTVGVPGDTTYYGGSFRQLSMMQVPQLHALGLSGAGVLVCMLDTGFNPYHSMFIGLSVLATRDFIHQDLDVNDWDAAAYTHGTYTLGCVAGSKPGWYSGSAFAATVALAKTEDVASETAVEMDYWQFGAEWADSLGADVISSSLGYSEFDHPSESYKYRDMDGQTTVVTLAALEAVRRGITVVTSAGNDGANPWHYIHAPADADTVIAVGAVDSFNVVTSFSSRGPTADGRIKPDVTAMGLDVLLPSVQDDLAYVRRSGTSFSAPLTAGLVALLLEAHPGWGPFEVREALRETALNHAAPNNDIGWGLVQGLAANAWVPSTTAVAPGAGPATGLALTAGPNPVRPGAESVIRFAAAGSEASIEVFDIGGRRRARLFEGPAAGAGTIRWNGVAADGAALGAGVYWIRLSARSASGGMRSRSVPVVIAP